MQFSNSLNARLLKEFLEESSGAVRLLYDAMHPGVSITEREIIKSQLTQITIDEEALYIYDSQIKTPILRPFADQLYLLDPEPVLPDNK